MVGPPDRVACGVVAEDKLRGGKTHRPDGDRGGGCRSWVRPLFWDGTCIEVYGKQFEGAARTYGDTDQFGLRGVFLGPMQVGGRLAPGGEDPVGDWRTQLTEDIDLVVPPDTPVWV